MKEFPELKIEGKRLVVKITATYEITSQEDVENVHHTVDEALDKLREQGSATVDYDVSAL